MTLDVDDLLNSILSSLDRITYIHPNEIPDMDLYMDQVTKLMGEKLKSSTRYPQTDKILTKTMINNYAKNDLMPPPVKKKYTKEHIFLLIFIYYYKGIMSISDIQKLLQPITEKYFQKKKDFSLEAIYQEVFSLEKEEVERLKDEIVAQYHAAENTFQDAPEEDLEFLKMFSFICILSFDVYVKQLLIEKLLDTMDGTVEESKKKKK